MSTPFFRPDPALRLDRTRVRRAFDRASGQYEAVARLQGRVNDELLERLEFFRFEPRVVLDLGAGTGRGARALARMYPDACVIALDISEGMLQEARREAGNGVPFGRVCADALNLPIADASADVVFSNLMLQWCDELDLVLAEVSRVLKPEGFFAFTTFGPDTLKELRAAWSAAEDGHCHVNAFIDMHDVGDALVRAGLTEPVLDVERVVLTYPDAISVMRELKAIGAHNVTAGRARGLTGRRRWQRVSEAYEVQRRPDGIPATYEVIYGAAWGSSASRGLAAVDGEVLIPPDAIRRRTPR